MCRPSKTSSTSEATHSQDAASSTGSSIAAARATAAASGHYCGHASFGAYVAAAICGRFSASDAADGLLSAALLILYILYLY